MDFPHFTLETVCPSGPNYNDLAHLQGQAVMGGSPSGAGGELSHCNWGLKGRESLYSDREFFITPPVVVFWSRPRSPYGLLLRGSRAKSKAQPRVEGSPTMKQQNQTITPPAKSSRPHYVTMRRGEISHAERNAVPPTKKQMHEILAEAVRNTEEHG
jgi:hypothetical protein